MRTFHYFIISIMCVISINAQTQKSQSVNSGKIAVINFELLKDEKTGIKEFANINGKLEIEFKTQTDELHLLFTDVQTLFKQLREFEIHPPEITKAEKLEEVYKSKLNEYELAGCRLLTKQQVLKSLFDKRRSDLVKEVSNKIAEKLKLFAKEKDFTVILDSSQNNLLVEGEIIDATKDFIQFYNNQTEKK